MFNASSSRVSPSVTTGRSRHSATYFFSPRKNRTWTVRLIFYEPYPHCTVVGASINDYAKHPWRSPLVGAGVLASLARGRLVESQLFGIKANDPMVMLVAVGVIISVTALAAYVPARRATGIDPMNALRYE